MFREIVKKQNSRALITIICIAVVLRFGLFVAVLSIHPEGFFQIDSYEYWAISENLLQHGVYSQSQEELLLPDHRRTPLYPLFIAGIRALGFNASAIIFLQVILSLFNILLAMEIAYKLFKDRRTASIAGLFLAIDIPSIVLANTLLTETLFTTFFILSVLFLISYFGDKRIQKLFISGLSLGLAALCRPIVLFFPVVVVIVLLIFSWKKKHTLLYRIPIFIVSFLLVLIPWVARNKVVFQTLFLSTITYTNMLEYRAAGVYAFKENISFSEAQQKLRQIAELSFDNSAAEDPIGYLRHKSKIGAQYCLSHPVIYITNNFRAVLLLFLNPLRSTIDLQLGLTQRSSALMYWGEKSGMGLVSRFLAKTSPLTIILVLIQMVVILIFWVFFLIGLFFSYVRKNFLAFYLSLLVLMYFAVITGGPEANARFRAPLIPLLAAMSGYGITCLVEYFRKRKSPPLISIDSESNLKT